MSLDFTTFLPLLSLAGWLSMFALKHKSLWAGNMAGLVYHLALIPLVEHLPGGMAVKFAGYLWLFMDALIDLCSINHMSEKNVWALRMGVHLFAGIWIFGVSWGLGGFALAIGLVLSLGLLLHASCLADHPQSKMILGVFVVPIMSAWLLVLQYLALFVGFVPL